MSQKSERLLKIYSLLKRGPVSVDFLSTWASRHQIDISPRTFYRDLKDLESSLLVPGEKLVVSTGEKNKKVWKIVYSTGFDPLNEFDINSYILFKNLLPASILKSRKSSLSKLLQLFFRDFSKSKFEYFIDLAEKQIDATNFYENSSVENYEKVLEDAIWSIQNRREMNVLQIRYDYTSIAEHICFPVTLLPLKLLYHRGIVHVCGLLKNTEEVVVIAVEQFVDYKLSNDMFDSNGHLEMMERELAKRFGVTENINKEVYDIVLEFSSLTASFVRNQNWHKSQVFAVLPNGNWIMKLRCGINRELVGWVFQWVSNVKVLEPPLLKQLILQKLEEVIELNQSDKELISNNSFRSQ